MRQGILSRLASLLVLLPGFVRGAEDWSRLKIGMTEDDAVAALGEPLVRTSGHGIELWIYDNRAEVLFYGPLIGWTTPSTDQTPGQAVDIWQRSSAQADAPVFLLPRPPRLRKDIPARLKSYREEGNRLPYLRLGIR